MRHECRCARATPRQDLTITRAKRDTMRRYLACSLCSSSTTECITSAGLRRPHDDAQGHAGVSLQAFAQLSSFLESVMPPHVSGSTRAHVCVCQRRRPYISYRIWPPAASTGSHLCDDRRRLTLKLFETLFEFLRSAPESQGVRAYAP